MDALPRNDSSRVPSVYTLLAELPLEIDAYHTERKELDVSSGFLRVTTTVVLRGGGHEGRGEDVTYAAEDHEPYPLALPLAGAWTLDGFSQLVGGLDLFPDRPLCFAVSTRLDITPWLAVDPALEFKLDPTPEWDTEAMRRIAATGRVRVLDFKAFYEGSPVDNPPDPVQYRAAAAAFPDAILEDPALSGLAREALDGEEGRFSFDAPIHSWADVESIAARAFAGRPLPLRHLNIKPSRFGSVSALLDCVERAEGAGMVLYGGGQFELGVGRDQIQALASLLSVSYTHLRAHETVLDL